MTQLLFVGMGGFLGSVTRFLLAGLVQGATAGTFPFGTLVVNVTGCIAIGALSELVDTRPFLTADARAFLAIGLLGGFTTFSAFSLEMVLLIERGQYLFALLYAVLSIALGITGLMVGLGVMRMAG